MFWAGKGIKGIGIKNTKCKRNQKSKRGMK
jgi:hypothetical protein